MSKNRQLWAITLVTLLLALLFLAIWISGRANTTRAPPEPRELPGLWEATDMPVESIPLRQDLPDHPSGPPTEEGQEEPEGAIKPRELPGLREAPEIPVDSIPLRHDLPDHPHGPPSNKGKEEISTDEGTTK